MIGMVPVHRRPAAVAMGGTSTTPLVGAFLRNAPFDDPRQASRNARRHEAPWNARRMCGRNPERRAGIIEAGMAGCRAKIIVPGIPEAHGGDYRCGHSGGMPVRGGVS